MGNIHPQIAEILKNTTFSIMDNGKKLVPYYLPILTNLLKDGTSQMNKTFQLLGT